MIKIPFQHTAILFSTHLAIPHPILISIVVLMFIMISMFMSMMHKQMHQWT